MIARKVAGVYIYRLCRKTETTISVIVRSAYLSGINLDEDRGWTVNVCAYNLSVVCLLLLLSAVEFIRDLD